MGPEDEQEFNRPEDTREGMFGEEIISDGRHPVFRGSVTRGHPAHRGEAAEVGRADHK